MAVTRASNQERLPFLSQFRIEEKNNNLTHVNKGRTQKIQMDPLDVFNTKKKSFNLKVRDHKKKKRHLSAPHDHKREANEWYG